MNSKRIANRISVWCFSLFVVFALQGQDDFLKIKSSYSVKETVEKLSNVLSDKGMTIFSAIDHQKGAFGAELELRPTTVVIFGNPKVGTKLMQCDQKAGLELPLKMVIWEDDGGDTWLGYTDPLSLKGKYNLESCSEVIKKVKNAMANFAKAATL